MKRFLFALIPVAAACAITGCSHSGGEPTAGAAEHAAEPESRVKHGTNGEVVITLDAATQKVMGLETVSLVTTQMSAQVKGFGRVLDPAPLMDLMVELGKAHLEFDASHAELERMKVLKQQNNVSEKTFQAAENTYQQNMGSVWAVRLKIQSSWGAKLAEMTGPIVVPVGTARKWDATLDQVLDARNVLVRVDLSAGEHLEWPPGSARLVPLGEGALPIAAWFFDTARTVDPQTQGQGLLFLVATNRPKLLPGKAVTAYMETADAPAAGVIVPRSAVVRFNGATWVYLQTGDDTFERVEVALDRPLDVGWFVAKGLKADAKIVTVGAQQLLSEELKGQGGEE